jgi:hypothetical protein
MVDSKLEIKVGSISFSGEGRGEWLSKQLDKVLAKIPELVAVAPSENSENGSDATSSYAAKTAKASGTLAAFLKAKNAGASQPRKFLATAIWLHDSEKKTRLSTTDISGALSRNNQGKLKNASDCLIQNAKKGFCEREGKQFYVTDEGRADLK